MDGFQMLCMHQDTGKFIAVHFQPEKHAQAYIINAACLSPVHGLCMVGIIMLWSGRVKLFIGFLVICLLEQDISADTGIMKLLIIFHRSSCNIDIYPADGAILMLDIVNGVDGFQHIFDRIVDRILPQLDGKALVSHILQGDYFLADFVLSQLLAADMLIFQMIRAVQAAIDAVVGKVQRRKQHNAVAVVVFLDLPCQVINLLQLFLVVAGQEHGGLPVGKPLAKLRLGNNGINYLHIVLVLIGILQGCLYFLVGDKFLCLH